MSWRKHENDLLAVRQYPVPSIRLLVVGDWRLATASEESRISS